jgi:hypothetical protein
MLVARSLWGEFGLESIICACWKANKPYDESFYLQALAKKEFFPFLLLDGSPQTLG